MGGKPNWVNRTVWTGDNLDIMRGMNDEAVDLIYLDPPFNSNRNYEAPIGSEAAGAAFKDTWTLSDVDEAWHGEIADREPALYAIIDAAGVAHGKGMKSYLIMMGVRLLEMRRILKPTGSIYLHCDPTASHYLKMLMDGVIGVGRFRNEIVWSYKKWTNSARCFQRNHDTLLFYSNGPGGGHTFNKQFGEPTQRQVELRELGYNGGTSSGKKILRVYDRSKAKNKIREAEEQGIEVYYVRDELKGDPVPDVWNIPFLNGRARERTGYRTQKPLALLDRIILASSNPGDVVLDPFCGCATTCIAAEKAGRRWAGIDLSPLAVDLVIMRAEREIGGLFRLAHRQDVPKRTDRGKVLPYRTHKHTLFGRQEGLCNGCRHSFPFRNFTIDHRVPRAKGGGDHLENLQLLCGACNSTKGDREHAFLIATLRREGRLNGVVSS